MKTKSLSLSVTDLDDRLSPELHTLLNKVTSSPRQRLGGPRDRKGKPMLVLHDWRKVGMRYLHRHARKFNPHLWIYRGGRHLAIHEPHLITDDFGNEVCTGHPCLARIVEA